MKSQNPKLHLDCSQAASLASRLPAGASVPLTLQPETALPWAFLASPALSSLSPPPPPDGRDASGVRLRRCGGAGERR